MEVRLLGTIEVTVDGAPIELGGARQRALLALLTMHANEPVARDKLIDALWGEQPSENAANALAALVARLRRALPTEAVVTRSGGYELVIDPLSIDAVRFERLVADAGGAAAATSSATLREALALWRGPPLAEFAYEDWAQPYIARLDETRRAAIGSRIQADLELGRSGELIGELEALVRDEPLHERFRGQLMLALYRAGRQAEALEAYRRARDTLVEGLGLEPSPELQELERAILRHDPGLVPVGAETGGRRSLLVCAKNRVRLDDLLTLATPLALDSERDLILVALSSADELRDTTTFVQKQRDAAAAQGVQTRAAAFSSTSPGPDVVKVAHEQRVDLVLVDGEPTGLDERLLHLLTETPSDVGILFGVGGSADLSIDGPVLVPFGGSEHEWAAAEIGAWLARAARAELRLAGTRAQPDAGRRDASRLLATASLAIQRVSGVASEPLLLEPGAAGVISAARDCSVVVLGVPERWQAEGLGTTRLAICRDSPVPVLLVRGGVRPSGLSPRESLTRYTWSVSS
jgi:DNA-binding SARP family transcriptional activator